MTYRETLEYLYSRLPVFTRIGKAAYKADLNNTLQLCASLGNPERAFRSVHIAGTNGKGSSSHFIASVMQEAGYKTGLFTSPHLRDFRERIRVNGKMIPARRVSAFVKANQHIFETIKPSFFEMNVALAFDYFRQEEVDIAIIETGLGGRLDSTNVLNPELSLITNISFDHKELLGDTLEKIALEKAGIIKKGKPIVVAETQESIAPVFLDVANRMGSKLFFADKVVRFDKVHKMEGSLHLQAKIQDDDREKCLSLESPLSGNYQLKNLKGVLLCLELLRKQGWKIQEKHIKQGVQKVIHNTSLHGRWEKIHNKPDVICDTGHNEAGVKEVLQLVKEANYAQLHLVWGMVADKDIQTILAMLPKEARYYFCRAAIPRALDATLLMKQAREFGLNGRAYSSVRRALAAARRTARPDDLVLVGGSTFVVAEVINS